MVYPCAHNQITTMSTNANMPPTGTDSDSDETATLHSGEAPVSAIGSGKFRQLAIELGGVVECANGALWNCMELSHGQSSGFNEAKLQSELAHIRSRMDAIARIFPNDGAKRRSEPSAATT